MSRGERAGGSTRFASRGELANDSARFASPGERTGGSARFSRLGERGDASTRFAGQVADLQLRLGLSAEVSEQVARLGF